MEGIAKFEEDEAIKFIRATLPADKSAQISDDEILYVIDCIWDWYERNGYLAINADVTDEEEMDVTALTDYVKKEMRRAREFVMDPNDVEAIVEGELQYEESIEQF